MKKTMILLLFLCLNLGLMGEDTWPIKKKGKMNGYELGWMKNLKNLNLKVYCRFEASKFFSKMTISRLFKYAMEKQLSEIKFFDLNSKLALNFSNLTITLKKSHEFAGMYYGEIEFRVNSKIVYTKKTSFRTYNRSYLISGSEKNMKNIIKMTLAYLIKQFIMDYHYCPIKT